MNSAELPVVSFVSETEIACKEVHVGPHDRFPYACAEEDVRGRYRALDLQIIELLS